ncbi:unnamed protein product [Boreogadus saida]
MRAQVSPGPLHLTGKQVQPTELTRLRPPPCPQLPPNQRASCSSKLSKGPQKARKELIVYSLLVRVP